jgi:hypothetical protein
MAENRENTLADDAPQKLMEKLGSEIATEGPILRLQKYIAERRKKKEQVHIDPNFSPDFVKLQEEIAPHLARTTPLMNETLTEIYMNLQKILEKEDLSTLTPEEIVYRSLENKVLFSKVAFFAFLEFVATASIVDMARYPLGVPVLLFIVFGETYLLTRLSYQFAQENTGGLRFKNRHQFGLAKEALTYGLLDLEKLFALVKKQPIKKMLLEKLLNDNRIDKPNRSALDHFVQMINEIEVPQIKDVVSNFSARRKS